MHVAMVNPVQSPKQGLHVGEPVEDILAQALDQQRARNGQPSGRANPVEQANVVRGGPLRRADARHWH